MKNYYTRQTQSRTFIETYHFEEDMIVLHLGTGEIQKVPYTDENFAIVIDKMKQQAYESTKERKKVIRQRSSYSWLRFIGSSLGLVGLVTLCVASLTLSPIYLAPGFVLIIGGTIVSVYNSQREKECTRLLNDMEKNAIFTEIMEPLNRNIKNKNPNISSGLSPKAQRFIEFREDRGFDYPLMDKLSLNDMKTLRDNLVRQRNFGFDEPGATEATVKIIKLLPKSEEHTEK